MLPLVALLTAALLSTAQTSEGGAQVQPVPQPGDPYPVWNAEQQKAAQQASRALVNYDEDAVAPFTLEDPLRFADGRKVRRKKQWPERRQEILDIFQKEMYGQMPPASDIYVETLEEGPTLAGFGTRRQLRMWFRPDKTGPKVDWLVVTPNHVQGPVPVIMLLNYGGNHEFLYDEEIFITDAWMREKNGRDGNKASANTRGRYNHDGDRYVYPVGMLVARGYAVMTACYCDISPDPDPRETDEDGVILQDRFAYTGVFDLWGPRDPARDDNTTALNAWAWGLMRGMDWIEQDPLLDAERVVLTGCSRLAKAALIAGAFDERFPLTVPVQTGGGGVPLAKRNYGETVATEVAAFRHWYCRAYDKYANHTDEMPFDQHLLLSCIAPRALLVEGYDGKWFDTKGEFLSLQAASPVWKFLGEPALPKVGWPEDYDLSAVGPVIGYVRRDQEHGISAIDWTWMMDFADRLWAR
jgi:hypothetical protein